MFRMLLCVWCRVSDGTTSPTTSCQCYTIFTGFQFGSWWTLRSPAWSTIYCPAWRHHTWPQTVRSSLMRLDVGCIRPTWGRVSSDGFTASLVTMFCGYRPQAVQQSSSHRRRLHGGNRPHGQKVVGVMPSNRPHRNFDNIF